MYNLHNRAPTAAVPDDHSGHPLQTRFPHKMMQGYYLSQGTSVPKKIIIVSMINMKLKKKKVISLPSTDIFHIKDGT